MSNTNAALTPSVQGKHLSITDGQHMMNLLLYWSTVGALQHLTHARPNITYIVNHLSQFLCAPTDIHWQAVKHVLRYVQGTKHYGILLQPSSDLRIIAYSDADWAANVDDHRSVAAYCVFVGNNLVSWSSKKQSVVARSSTESEYRALTHASAEISWLQLVWNVLKVISQTHHLVR